MAKRIAFGCWNNERNISVPNQAGKLHGLLFTTEKAAREYYKNSASFGAPDDPIVRVTVETIDGPASSQGEEVR